MTKLKILPSGLRFRLVTIVLAALTPFVILIAFVARQHQSNERESTEAAAEEVAGDISHKIDYRIGSMEMSLLGLRHAISSDPSRFAENDRVLRQFAADLPPYYARFAVVTPSGKNIGTSEALPNGARAPIAFNASSGATAVGEFRITGSTYLFGSTGPRTLALSYKLDSAGTRLVGFMRISSLQKILLGELLPEGSIAALINEKGTVIATPRSTPYWANLKLNPDSFSPPDSDNGVGVLTEPNGAILYAAYAKLQHAPFRVYVATPESLAFAKARRDFWRAIGWGLLASFLGVMLAWTQASRIVRPMEELGEDAAILGAGELSHRSRIHSTDELGLLAKSINAMAETLERREAEAIQAQKMESVGQLAGGIAHDFNNLLTVISGRLELLAAGENVSPDEQEDIAEIRSATTRAISLTRQLLAFSRKQLLRPKTIDLNSVLDEIEPMLRRLIGEDVQIVIVRGPELGNILADPGQVHQVLLNLSLNARDAMPNGGLLRIETHNQSITADSLRDAAALQPGDYVVVSVTDTGHGMDDRTKARIFDPFFTTKSAGKGTGLGLSTVYGIVKQSGATIIVETAPGRGSTFRVYFPRSERPATGEYGVMGHPVTSGTESILIVEDERAVRDLATKILDARGYKVLSAAHGGDALQIIEGSARRIDLVLTDVVMPGMSGRELVESLRRARPGIKVLYMSGYTDDEIVRRGLLDPAVAFIQKPFTAEELAMRVRQTLDG